MQTKIATCCYCGTRAALVLTGETSHELACSSCGAPLHEMKSLKVPSPAPTRRVQWEAPRKSPGRPALRKGKKRAKKGLAHRFLKEAFDAIEDIFD